VQASVGEQHQDQVVEGEVGSQVAAVFRTVRELGQHGECALAYRSRIDGMWEGRGERRGETAIAGMQLEELVLTP
jgi:hypothetical protein